MRGKRGSGGEGKEGMKGHFLIQICLIHLHLLTFCSACLPSTKEPTQKRGLLITELFDDISY